MAASFKHFAFLSYNSKDTALGKRLQKNLEQYQMHAMLYEGMIFPQFAANNIIFVQ